MLNHEKTRKGWRFARLFSFYNKWLQGAVSELT